MIVEDEPRTARILRQTLRHPRREVCMAGNLAEAEKVLQAKDVLLILLDLQLPDGDGRDLLTKLRTRPETSGIPIFIVSSLEGPKIQTDCFARGADAYFQKPFHPEVLATAVTSKLRRVANIPRSTSIDALTGLPNRVAFKNGFRRAAMLASRSQQPLSVAMLDVDRFKSVNDLYGHLEGDRVLRRLAAVVSRSLRASDLLARWGGEEFAVLFPNTAIDHARVALKKALSAFRTQHFAAPDDRGFQVTFSAGITQWKGRGTMDQAMGEADRLLYLAKTSGRNRVVTDKDRISLKKTILIVEDDQVTASILKQCLKNDGLDVVHAKEGKSALAAASEKPVSLISLDVKGPGLDGFDLLQKFRLIPALHQIPIIMVTSAGKQEDIVRGFQMGADDYMLKPFSPQEFLARIHRFLQKQ